MAASSYLLKVVKEQESLALAIADDRVTFFAKKVAFYEAMIEAALVDPLYDPMVHKEILEHLRYEKNDALSAYKNLVNENF